MPVVIHDATLRRTASLNRRVEQMSSIELAGVDAGSGFNRAHPPLAQAAYSHEHVPTLEQVFELVRKRRGVMYVEIKSEEETAAGDLVRSVADLIRRFALQKRVTVVSFNLAALAMFKIREPATRTGALFAPRSGVKAWSSDQILLAAAGSGADEILLHRLLARPKLVKRCTEQDLPVTVWTVDDLKWLSRAQAHGIRALITNDPVRFVNALARARRP